MVDCLVVGVEDEKFGQKVTGVASLRPGCDVDAEALREFTRTQLAAYKVPKNLFVVETVQRAPNGQADYGWARNAVEEALEACLRVSSGPITSRSSRLLGWRID